MTSAIARWHSSARPPSDALEQAYADQLEAKMQEMAIQLHKVTPGVAGHSLRLFKQGRRYININQSTCFLLLQRCEEVEGLQNQVSQEKELRTMMEGCLMEEKMAWTRVHGELVENHRLAQEMNAALLEARARCSELLAHFSANGSEDRLVEGDSGVSGERRGVSSR